MNRFAHLVSGSRWIPQADGSYLLVHPDGDRRLKMGRLEHAILSALDGRTPPSEVARNLARALGRPLPPGALEAILGRLEAQGFVELPARPPVAVMGGSRASCLGCGHCCHFSVGPLSALELQRVPALAASLPEGERPDPTTLLRSDGSDRFLTQSPSSAACLFLEAPQGCRIHRHFGGELKPAICRLYPLYTVDVGGHLRAAFCYECPGVRAAGDSAPAVAEHVRGAGDVVAATTLAVSDRALAGATESWTHASAEELVEAALARERRTLDLLQRDERRLPQVLATITADALADAQPDRGAPLRQWLRWLLEALRAQRAATASPYFAEALRPLERGLAGWEQACRHEGPRGTAAWLPASTAEEELLRRAWANYVFARHPLFAGGQQQGLVLLLVLHGLVARARRPHPSHSAEATSAALRDMLLLLRVLPDSGAPTPGAVTLRELLQTLETAGAPAPAEPLSGETGCP